MKYRKDITDYLIQNHGIKYKKRDYKIYEQNDILYMAGYEYGKNKINRFTSYAYLWHEDDIEIRSKIEKTFNVKFANEGAYIVCKCGESKNFSSFYGSYEIILKCNKCENQFTAYSG